MIFTNLIKLLISAETQGAVAPLGQLEKQAAKTDSAFDKMSKTIGVSSGTLKAGLAGAAAALVGTGLVEFLDRTAGAYADAAIAANQLSAATNASVEDASRFGALAGRYGLDLSALTEIFADLQQASGEGGKNLEALGVTIAKNADGLIDWIGTAVNFLEVLQDIPDATERNRLMFKFFGEEGAKQLMSLVNSGISVKEALEGISTAQIFGTDDVQAAMEYNRAMQGLASAAKDAQFALGRQLAPVVADVTNLLVPLLGVLKNIPVEMLLVVGAARGLQVAFKALMASNAMSGFAAALVGLPGLLTRSTFSVQALTASLVSLSASAGPLLALVAVISAVVGEIERTKNINAFVTRSDVVTKSLRDQAQELRDTDSVWSTFLEGTDIFGPWMNNADKTTMAMWDLTGTIRNQAEAILESETATEAQIIASENLLDVLGDGTIAQQTANLATEEGRKAQEAYADSLAPTEAAAYRASVANKSLTDIIASGIPSQQEYANAVSEAAAAQYTQEQNARLAAEAVQAVADASTNAVNATLALNDAQAASREAARSVADSVDTQADAQDKLNELKTEPLRKGETREQRNRDIERQARDVERQTDAIVSSVERQAAAAVEAEGLTMDSLEGQARYAETVQEIINSTDLGPAMDEVEELQAKLDEAKIDLAGGWEFGGIKWKGSTSQKEIEEARREINLARKAGEPEMARAAQERLNKLQFGSMDLPGAEDQTLTVVVDTTALDTAKADVATMSQTPIAMTLAPVAGVDTARADLAALQKPLTTTLSVKVFGWFGNEASLATLARARNVPYATEITNFDDTDDDLDDLGRDRTVEYKTKVTNVSSTKLILDTLDKDHDVYYRVHVLGASVAAGILAGLEAKQTSAIGTLLNGSAAASRPNFNPTININNPLPERSSSSVAMAMRVARYSAGVV
jgi:hypothetical protein